MVTTSVVFASTASADLTFTRVFTVDQLVPHGGEYADARTLSLGGRTVTDVNIGLVLAPPAGNAAWAGDYYATVGHETGYAVLLNRIDKSTTDDFPGNNPATTTFTGDTVFGPAHLLTMEIGGTAPGTGYDTIDVTGTLTRGGILSVVFINGFIPAPTDFSVFSPLPPSAVLSRRSISPPASPPPAASTTTPASPSRPSSPNPPPSPPSPV